MEMDCCNEPLNYHYYLQPVFVSAVGILPKQNRIGAKKQMR